MINTLKNSQRISSIIIKKLHSSNQEFRSSIKYDILKDSSEENVKNFEKEFLPTHWLHKHLPRPDRWINEGEQMKVFDFDKDTEFGRYAWNSNGCYTNRLANLFYRSPAYIKE
jgi:hypothetical protein